MWVVPCDVAAVAVTSFLIQNVMVRTRSCARAAPAGHPLKNATVGRAGRAKENLTGGHVTEKHDQRWDKGTVSLGVKKRESDCEANDG